MNADIMDYSSPETFVDAHLSQRTLNQSVMGPSSNFLSRFSQSYEAFNDDIAVVHFYFETQTVLEFTTVSSQGRVTQIHLIQETPSYP